MNADYLQDRQDYLKPGTFTFLFIPVILSILFDSMFI